MTETTTKRPRGTWRRRILIFLIGAVLLILLVRSGLDFWAGRRINAQVALLEQKYGSLDPATLTVPAVPESENRARAIRAAIALIEGQPGAQASLSRFLAQRSPAPVPPDLRAFVEANRGALRQVDEARARRQSNWETDYSNSLNHPPLLNIRTLSSVITLAVRMDLEAGRTDDAAAGIASGLALSASLRQEPSLISQLIRIAVAFHHFESVQRLLTGTEPSMASLDVLANWLAENRMPDPMHVGLLGEMKTFNAAFVGAANGNGLPFAPGVPILGRLTWIARPSIRLFHARYLEQVGLLLENQTGPRPRPIPPTTRARLSWFGRLNSMAGIEGLERAVDTGDTFNGQLAVTELAVALRRHRLDHGQYPDALSALVPAYLVNVPIDPVTGKPPVYGRKGSGFRLTAEKGRNVTPQMALLLEWTVPK